LIDRDGIGAECVTLRVTRDGSVPQRFFRFTSPEAADGTYWVAKCNLLDGPH